MASTVTVEGGEGSPLSAPLVQILMADEIQPGSDPSYELCRTIFTHHTLGGTLAAKPVTMAQDEPREVIVQDAPDEVPRAFLTEWEQLGCDRAIHNLGTLSRVYGVSTLTVGCEEFKSDEPLPLDAIWDKQIWINVLDPLNTAGSLVLNLDPNAPDFLKPKDVTTQGSTYHKSRRCVLMNEHPVFLEYTTSAYGFVGRSVYQRALFPLKSFIRSMIANDMVQTKLGVLILKKKNIGSTTDGVMARVMNIFRGMLKSAQTNQVLSMGVEEDASTLNMQNVDGAGTYSRNNILKDIATACDMPAKLVANEELVEGFGEGTEDAKMIAGYVGTIRKWLQPAYAFLDNIVRHRAWNPEFCQVMRQKYPDRYGKSSDAQMFAEWKHSFTATWPDLVKEDPKAKADKAKSKFDTLLSALQTLMGVADPENKAVLIQWAQDTINEAEELFPVKLDMDMDTLKEFLEEQQQQQEEAQQMGGMPGMGGPPGAAPNPSQDPGEKPPDGAKPAKPAKGKPKLAIPQHPAKKPQPMKKAA